MDFAALAPGVIATLISTGILALATALMPGVRWSRQLAREVNILSGLPEGDERAAWEERVVAHARRLRLFQDFIPTWNKVLSWFPVALFVSAVALMIADPRQLETVIAEGPVMISLSIAALIGTASFFMTAVLGLRTDGKSGEDIARERGALDSVAVSAPPAEKNGRSLVVEGLDADRGAHDHDGALFRQSPEDSR